MSRLPLLLALLGASALLALLVWREPLELWRLRREPLSVLERYVQGHPESELAVLSLARAYQAHGRDSEAAGALAPWVERHPFNADARVTLAESMLSMGRTSEAYAQLQVVLTRLSPSHAEARYWLGRTLEQSERTEEATAEYERLLEKQPRHAPTLVRLARIAYLRSQNSAAARYYRAAAAADPTDPDAAVGLAEVLFRLGDIDAAVSEGRRAARLAPQSGQAHLWLGRALHAARTQPGPAEAAYRQAIAASEDKAAPMFYLAQLLRELGRVKEAAEYLREATEENPLHQAAFYELALCARALGNRALADQAQRRYDELSRLDLEGAELEYRVWAEPDVPHLRLRLARFYLKHRRPELAWDQVERLLHRHPDHEEARELRKRLRSRDGERPE